MLELTVLIVSIAIVLIVLYFKGGRTTRESFENYYLKSCPPSFKTFYDGNGDVACCDGDIMANRCLGDNQCALTGTGTPDMPNCTSIILDSYKEKSKQYCTKSMPQYFENKAKQIRGCTSGSLNDTLDGPRQPSQPMCGIYPLDSENKTMKDSCYTQKQIDAVECFGANCTKDAIQPGPSMPLLIRVGFTDETGIHRTAYSKESMINYLNVVLPNWRNSRMNIDKMIENADVAKAFYIDRTMQASDVQWY